MNFLFSTVLRNAGRIADSLQHTFIRWTKPASMTPFVGTVMDLSKTKPELVAENAFLRQQLIILTRQVKHPKFHPSDRFLLVVLAALVQNWKQLLLIAQPVSIITLSGGVLFTLQGAPHAQTLLPDAPTWEGHRDLKVGLPSRSLSRHGFWGCFPHEQPYKGLLWCLHDCSFKVAAME